MSKETSISFVFETVLTDLEGGIDQLAADIHKVGSVSQMGDIANLLQVQMNGLKSLLEGLAVCGILEAGELRAGIADLAVVAAALRARLNEATKATQHNQGRLH